MRGKVNVEKDENSKSIIFNLPCKDFEDCTPYKINLPIGEYRIELWGGKGGDSRIVNQPDINKDTGGKGAYVSGKLFVGKEQPFYLYIGGRGEDMVYTDRTVTKGGYNGGGKGGVDLLDGDLPESASGGGGATDIRLIPGMTSKSLRSRIIVAGGGGGGSSSGDDEPNVERRECRGGDGGMLVGGTYINYSVPGTQTSGIFGRGQDGLSFNNDRLAYGGATGGSGGGYYGGITLGPLDFEKTTFEMAGAGGSSYISGYTGCNSVANDDSETPNHLNIAPHYSGIVFQESVMKQKGSEGFVDPHGQPENGHFGNGAAKITIISQFPIKCITMNPSYKPKTFMFVSSITFFIVNK